MSLYSLQENRIVPDSPTPPSAPQDELRGRIVEARFLRRYRCRRVVLSILDTLLGFFLRREVPEIPIRPRRVLIGNAAHLGDAVMTTSLFPILHHAYPGVEIGVLAGTWCESIVARHPLVRRVHYLDHWYFDRSPRNRFVKVLNYVRQRRAMVRELRESSYDIAVDARVSLPNWAPLLWSSRIPVRVGSTFAGFSSLLTHPVRYEYATKNRIYEQAELLRALGLPYESFEGQAPCLPENSREEEQQVEKLFCSTGISAHSFRLLHTRASIPERDWLPGEWRRLSENLVEQGKTLLFTGKGRRDCQYINEVIAGLPRCVNACDRLSWGGFVAAIRRAEVIYSVDTVAGHIASAVGTPCVSILGGMFEGEHFGPWGSRKVVVTNPVACAPCFQARGCKDMACLWELHARRVYEAGEMLLREIGAPGK